MKGAAKAGSEHLEARKTSRVRWTLVLTWFMRLVALAWIAKGLQSWATILGVLPNVTPFEARSLGGQATVIYFAVIDLVAAVGLWLISTWGGVLWLLAIMSHMILAGFFPRIVPTEPAFLGVFLVLIVTYLVLSWMAASEEQS